MQVPTTPLDTVAYSSTITLADHAASPLNAEPGSGFYGWGLSLLHGFASFPVHERCAEDAIGLVLVVRATAEPEIGDCGQASQRHRLDMVEVEKPALGASVPFGTHERAPCFIAFPDGASDRCGDVS